MLLRSIAATIIITAAAVAQQGRSRRPLLPLLRSTSCNRSETHIAVVVIAVDDNVVVVVAVG